MDTEHNAYAEETYCELQQAQLSSGYTCHVDQFGDQNIYLREYSQSQLCGYSYEQWTGRTKESSLISH